MKAEAALPTGLLPALLHGWTWKMAWRDSRTQRKRLVIFSVSVIVGIASLVAIHALKASAMAGVEREAKSLLGADLVVSSHQPIPENIAAKLLSKSEAASREIVFGSMAYFPSSNGARLIQIHAVESGFPFYGTIETNPPDARKQIEAQGGILLEAALLEQFGAKQRDVVKIGELKLPIAGVLEKAAARGVRADGFSPVGYIRYSDAERTGLLGGARLVTYALDLKLKRVEEAESLKRAYAKATALRFETEKDRREALGNSLDNMQEFLGVIALASLVLGAIGVAGAMHSHVRRRMPTIAALRCLGCSADVAFSIYLIQAVVLGFIGASAGALIGVCVHGIVLSVYRDSLPIALDASPHWAVVAITAAAGLAVCLGFSLIPLAGVKSVSPMALIREDPAAKARWFAALPIYAAAALALAGLSVLDTAHRLRALGMAGGLCAAILLLAGSAKLLSILARRISRYFPSYLVRQGVANLYRPHNQTLLFMLSVGLGAFLLLTVALAREQLMQQMRTRDLTDSPNIYMIDVQPDQLDGVKSLIQSMDLPILETAPIITMRLQSVRGTPVSELEKDKKIPKWTLNREYRSTYRAQLKSSEKLVSGKWIDSVKESPEIAPVSIEEEIAKDLRLKLGDNFVMDVQGVPIAAKVTSIRKVDWSQFHLNFFMVFPPGVLDSAPGFDVVTTRAPSTLSSGALQRATVKQFPNVSVVDLTLIFSTIQSIVGKVAFVISTLAGITILAGLPIIIGALLNGRDQRLRESVLLRTLGASEKQVRSILLVEYSSLGALSAAAGVVLAVAANLALAKYVFESQPAPVLLWVLLTFCVAVLISVTAGMLLSRGVSRHSPLAILRGMVSG